MHFHQSFRPVTSHCGHAPCGRTGRGGGGAAVPGGATEDRRRPTGQRCNRPQGAAALTSILFAIFIPEIFIQCLSFFGAMFCKMEDQLPFRLPPPGKLSLSSKSSGGGVWEVVEGSCPTEVVTPKVFRGSGPTEVVTLRCCQGLRSNRSCHPPMLSGVLSTSHTERSLKASDPHF